MYISKTPLRISLFSGGDMATYYEKSTGVCLSCTIDKYVYVTVSHNPAGIRVMFDETQDTNNHDDIKNVIVKETLKMFNEKNVTISNVIDIPYKGSGLGSSSAFTVGLIAALYPPRSAHEINKHELAELACDIEINKCQHPIGKQDQYAAAFGGLNTYYFKPGGNVVVKNSMAASKNLKRLEEKLLLVYSGISRNANDVLKEQQANLADNEKFSLLTSNASRAVIAHNWIEEGNLNDLGELMHEAWLDKKAIASSISNPKIDEIYEVARKAGATGGKLIGAGGGGFFIFYCPRSYIKHNVIEALTAEKFSSGIPYYEDPLRPPQFNCKVYPFKFVEKGCEVFKI